MSDNFIPLNQSTPINRKLWEQNGGQQQRYNNQQFSGKRRGGYKNWNNSRSSYGSNSSNNSYNQDRHNIDAYLHPAMLQDPWASLRQQDSMNTNNSSSQ